LTKLSNVQEGSSEDPSFSPDGNYIIFSSSRDGMYNLYIMSANGVFVKKVQNSTANETMPKWSGKIELPVGIVEK